MERNSSHTSVTMVLNIKVEILNEGNLNNWENEITFGELNNTSQDLTPYVLTAWHCVEPESPGDHNTFTFYFNHQSSTCNGNSGYYGNSRTGSYLRASKNFSSIVNPATTLGALFCTNSILSE